MSNRINIDYKNCGNIAEGTITISPKKLNIKYGINGVGKTTLAKTLEGAVKNDKDLINNYVPFGSDESPEVLHEGIESIIVFDQNYINNFLYKKGDTLNNTYEIAIKTTDYDKINKELNKILEDLVKLANTKEITELFKKLDETVNEIKPNKDNKSLNRASPFVKGINLSNIEKEIRENNVSNYQDLIIAPYASNWSNWFKDGSNYIINNKCPFCLEFLRKEFLMEHDKIVKTFDSKMIKHGMTTRKTLNNLITFSNEIGEKKIREDQNDGVFSDETIENIIKFSKSLKIEKEKLEQIRELNPISFFTHDENFNWYDTLNTDFNIEDLEIKIEGLVLDLRLFERVNKDVFLKIEKINIKLKEYLKDAKTLLKELQKLNLELKNNINKMELFVNSFLKISGIPYKLKTKKHNEIDFITKLVPINCDDKEIINPQGTLSFGELNALSLMLFCVEAVNGDYDLIILDDPVSSFDENKKYAIIHQLFKNEEDNLKDKTVLMFTHDFSPIIDFMHTGKPTKDITIAHYLYNNEESIVEKEITKNQIINNYETFKTIAKDEGKNILKRVVALRNLLELTGLKSNEKHAYDTLSSLIHARKVPTKINGEALNDSDISIGLNYIKNYIKDFDYNKIYNEITQAKKLKEWYENCNSFLKLIIARIYIKLKNKRIDDVLMKYLNECFHIEKMTVFGLNPNEYDLVPPFVLDGLDDFFRSKNESNPTNFEN